MEQGEAHTQASVKSQTNRDHEIRQEEDEDKNTQLHVYIGREGEREE